jgi:hypothetical protein
MGLLDKNEAAPGDPEHPASSMQDAGRLDDRIFLNGLRHASRQQLLSMAADWDLPSWRAKAVERALLRGDARAWGAFDG